MKLEFIGAFRKLADGIAIILDAAYDVSAYNYFQRSTVKEALQFALITLAPRLAAGRCTVVYDDEAKRCCHALTRSDGVSALCVTDEEYPARIAFAMLQDVVDRVEREYDGRWQRVVRNYELRVSELADVLMRYQTPTDVDPLARTKAALEETQEVMRKNIEAVLARGEKLDDLVAASEQLSATAKTGYLASRRLRRRYSSCCIIM